MKLRISRVAANIVVWLLVSVQFPGLLLAQNPSGGVRGQVTDPSGAAVPGAKVSAVSATGQTKAGVVHPDGTYEIRGLATGTYTLRVRAKGFTLFEQPNVQVSEGKTAKVDVALKIEQEVEKVEVTEETTKLAVNPQENASSIVIKGEDLQALSDDPDELQSELEALAGPSAGPNGGQIYIDGFTAGQLPPKADILEIHINQNPFSSEYDKAGYGRIEITTRPGSSQFHGQAFGDFNASFLNTRNPFAAEVPAYHTEIYNANLGGPLSKKASFFFNFFRRNIGDASIVSATVLGPPPTFTPTPYTESISSPRVLTNLGPRFDFQLSPNNVLSVRYQFYDTGATNSQIGQLSLASQGVNSSSLEHTVQVSDTEVFSARTLNRFRFQYLHESATSTPQNFTPTVSVLGELLEGGNASGTTTDTQNHYEVQNLTSFFLHKHTLEVGGRLRDLQDSNSTYAGFNGTFTFANITAYQIAEQNLYACEVAGGTNCQTSGPNQFSITAGIPRISVNMLDVGLFAQDDWQIRPGMTLSPGLRWESQTGIADHSDFAPRLGFAWGLNRHGKSAPKTVLRAGFGMFYDRFPETLLVNAERFNGINQQTYLLREANIDFFSNAPSVTLPSGLPTTPTRYLLDPALRAPYLIQSAVGIEQQVAKNTTVSVTYLNSHGVHQLFINDINAPIQGTFPLGEPQVGTFPFGMDAGNMYDYQSGGLFNQNQLITNVNMHLGTRFSLTGYYTLGYADADTSGNTPGFIMNPYDISQNYGRAAFDVRNRIFLFATLNLPHRISVSPMLIAASGTPMNVTVNQDLFGTSQFNSRPELAAPGATGSNIYVTPLGTFNALPEMAETIIPPYAYDNPGQFTMNLRLSKTISFGKETQRRSATGGGGWGGGRGGGGGLGRGLGANTGGGGFFGGSAPSNRRFNLTFSLMARNVFNNVNLGPRIGVLGSSLFAQSNSLGGVFGGGPGGLAQAANRRIDIQVIFAF